MRVPNGTPETLLTSVKKGIAIETYVLDVNALPLKSLSITKSNISFFCD